MSASVVKVCLRSLERFCCPACGFEILSSEGQSEALCTHVVAMVDWVDEFTVPDTIETPLSEALQCAFEQSGTLEAVAAVLPPSAAAFELVETARGGGHQGSSFTVVIDFDRS